MANSAYVSDPISVAGASFEVLHLEVEEGVELRVLHWEPERPSSESPFIFVAGWVSSIEGWADLMRALVKNRPVYYVETREKRSARITKRRLVTADFAIDRLAEDIIAVCEQLGLDEERIVLGGSSMGSTAIVEALKHGRLKARAAFVIGPSARFHFPWWGKLLTKTPAETYYGAVYLIIFYLRNFRVDSKVEPQQIERYERTLLSAVPLRMKLSAGAVYPYEIWQDLETIKVPVAVAHAPTDKLHREEEIDRLVSSIPAGRDVSCPTNLYMHCADVAPDIEGFISELAD